MAPVGHTWAQKPQPRQVSQSRSFFTGTAGWAGGSGSPGSSTLPAAPEADAPAANNNYLFVPDAQTVLDNVLELYLNNTVYAVMLEARVGEHAARMTAMTAATDSTAELIEDLNLEFNRARQAAITTEISEIVGGSAALKKSDKSD